MPGPFTLQCGCGTNTASYTAKQQAFFGLLSQFGIPWNDKIKAAFAALFEADEVVKSSKYYVVSMGAAPDVIDTHGVDLIVDNSLVVAIPELVGYDIAHLRVGVITHSPEENGFDWDNSTGNLTFTVDNSPIDNNIYIIAIEANNVVSTGFPYVLPFNLA